MRDMAFLFGGGKPPAPKPDPVREHRQELQRAARALDREDLKGVRSEALLKKEIEAHARSQRYDVCQDKARDLVRLRPEEQQLFDDLRHDRIREALRLEQERIGFSWISAALARLPPQSE
jgi:hypothetical protein